MRIRTKFGACWQTWAKECARSFSGPAILTTGRNSPTIFARTKRSRIPTSNAPAGNVSIAIGGRCTGGNCVGVGLQKIGFYLDGRYHTVLTLKRWPSHTYPGIVYRLTGLPFLDYQITVNVDPLPAKREVDKEEKAIERLRGEYEGKERHS